MATGYVTAPQPQVRQLQIDKSSGPVSQQLKREQDFSFHFLDGPIETQQAAESTAGIFEPPFFSKRPRKKKVPLTESSASRKQGHVIPRDGPIVWRISGAVDSMMQKAVS
ncbi:uncharacterized protein BCR38DRAFT_191741 [Pseudomassariella vexata]|uniref:Uncharacterized protein n=1 Tax=Pseudomassariella vexata TaxID=1141098 RepID=A0A1Y2E0Q6_9PEZI|nr:uncharacterized protein BCR38DRAFT_191741 [Pseudomassariella vexata]ORY65112.1 hypothetical protein BCR38DRAFT_191741 [Pseudomassariella vexata]